MLIPICNHILKFHWIRWKSMLRCVYLSDLQKVARPMHACNGNYFVQKITAPIPNNSALLNFTCFRANYVWKTSNFSPFLLHLMAMTAPLWASTLFSKRPFFETKWNFPDGLNLQLKYKYFERLNYVQGICRTIAILHNMCSGGNHIWHFSFSQGVLTTKKFWW